MFKRYRDLLSICVIFLIVALWIFQGVGIIGASGEIIGATIAAFTLVIQFYFRKKPASEDSDTTIPPNNNKLPQ